VPEKESPTEVEMSSSDAEAAAATGPTEVGTDEAESASVDTPEPASSAGSEVDPEPASDMVDPNSRLFGGEAFSDDDEADFSEERIQRILDIELPVDISFGSVKRPLSEVLKLGPGTVLELDRAADEPVTLRVNNKVFAKGEVVDVDGYYGVQITEIATPAQRLVSMGEGR
jgi:flagellar motor switch protein FliN/FliY